MKKIIIALLLCIFSLCNIGSVFAYWEFIPSSIETHFYTAQWEPLRNFKIKIRTAEWNVEWFTDFNGKLSMILRTPLEVELEKWEYSYIMNLWMSRFVLFNHKILNGIKIYYNTETWYISKVEWINYTDYRVANSKKEEMPSLFPTGAWFIISIFIIILAALASYTLTSTGDTRFLRGRNSTFNTSKN